MRERAGQRLQLLAADRAARAGADRGRALRRRDHALRRRPGRAPTASAIGRSRVVSPGSRGGRRQGRADGRRCRTCASSIDRDAIARYGINASQVLDVVQTMGGRRSARCSRAAALRICRCGSPPRIAQRCRAASGSCKVADPQRPADPALAARRDPRRGGPGADQPREHPPAHHRRGQRPRPRPRELRRRRRSARSRRKVKLPPGYCDRVGRAVREPAARVARGWPSSCRSRCC